MVTSRDSHPVLPSRVPTTSDGGVESRKRLPGWALLLLVCLLTVTYLWQFVYCDWIPHDEGTLAECAERTLHGELPHRDFDDMYTGGLSYLHATSFHLLGTRFSSSRTVLLIFSAVFASVFYWINVRLAPQWTAGLITFAGVVLSLPNYFAALPSWYVLFFTVFGIAAHLKYLDVGRDRWLLLAGLFGGVGVVFKITGVFYLASTILFLLFRSQVREDLIRNTGRPAGSVVWRLTIALGAGGMLMATLFLLRRHLGPETIAHFVLPIAGLCAVLIARMVWDGPRAGWPRLLAFGSEVGTFVLGACIPVAIFLAPYLAQRATADLIHGVFIAPQMRFEHAATPLPPMPAFSLAIVPAIITMIGFTRWGRRDWALACLAVPAMIALLVAARRPSIEWLEFSALRCFAPIAILLGCWELRPRTTEGTTKQQQELFLLLSMAAFCSLSQYPFSAPIYFCYVLPLFVISTHYFTSQQPEPPRRLYLTMLSGLIAFGVLFLNRGSTIAPVKVDADDPPIHRLDLPRAGLLLSLRDKTTYETLIGGVDRLSSPGAFIYATPDCPEVYFLSDRRNPTETMYDFFDQSTGRTERLLRLLDERAIEVVVINMKKRFSPIDPGLVEEVAKRFPHHESAGTFVLYSRRLKSR